MKNFEAMNIAECELPSEVWGDVNNPASNWSLANKYATFSHKDACEFIFYLGNKATDREDDTPIHCLESQGFGTDFISYCEEIRNAGFKYVCFYA